MYRNLTLPSGFTQSSFVKWEGSATVSPSGGDSITKDLSPQRLHFDVNGGSAGGEISLVLSVKYHLAVKDVSRSSGRPDAYHGN
jgi:hypothetical protein